MSNTVEQFNHDKSFRCWFRIDEMLLASASDVYSQYMH